jgi:hypothetical protein
VSPQVPAALRQLLLLPEALLAGQKGQAAAN